MLVGFEHCCGAENSHPLQHLYSRMLYMYSACFTFDWFTAYPHGEVSKLWGPKVLPPFFVESYSIAFLGFHVAIRSRPRWCHGRAPLLRYFLRSNQEEPGPLVWTTIPGQEKIVPVKNITSLSSITSSRPRGVPAGYGCRFISKVHPRTCSVSWMSIVLSSWNQ